MTQRRLYSRWPPVVFPDRHENPGRFAGFEDHDDLVRLGASKVRLDEFIASSGWSVDDGRVQIAKGSALEIPRNTND